MSMSFFTVYAPNRDNSTKKTYEFEEFYKNDYPLPVKITEDTRLGIDDVENIVGIIEP